MPGFEPEWKKKYNDMNFDKAEDANEPIPVEEYEDEEYVEEKKEAAVSDKITAYEMKTIALADEESYVEEVVEVVVERARATPRAAVCAKDLAEAVRERAAEASKANARRTST